MCFKEKEAAAKALTVLNEKDGLYIRKALKKTEREAEVKRLSEKYKKSQAKFNLYVKNIPVDTTEQELAEFFGRFGQLKNIKIMRQSKEDASSVPLGFGFVSYQSSDSAARAKLEVQNIPFKGVILFVSQFEPKETRQSHLAETIDKKMLERHKRNLLGQGVNFSLNQRSPQGMTWQELFYCALILRQFGNEQIQKLLADGNASLMQQIGGLILGIIRNSTQRDNFRH